MVKELKKKISVAIEHEALAAAAQSRIQAGDQTIICALKNECRRNVSLQKK